MYSRVFSIALLACATATLVRAATRQLAANDFRDVLDPLPAAFVMAMAPWCGHCVAAKPAFEAVDVPDVPTFMVDASKPEAESVRAYIGLRGFPTFVYLEHGRVVETYAGDRTTAAFEAYLSAKSSAKSSDAEPLTENETEAAPPNDTDAAAPAHEPEAESPTDSKDEL